MAPRHQHLLAALRTVFPQPVSDPVHDSYVVFSILRALDQVDAMKSQAPILGRPQQPDYAAAMASRLDMASRPLGEVVRELVRYLEGMFIWGHPRSQLNVIPVPNVASVIGVLLPALFNPNMCSDESALKFSEAEARVVAMAADLVGYDPATAGGVFTFGGTGTLLYGIKIGLEKACPDALQSGVCGDAVVLTSTCGHYASYTVAAWLGLGQDRVISVPADEANSIDVAALEAAAREALAAGRKIAAIVATLGSTDAFGIDDLAAISELRDRLVDEFKLPYRIHVHADAVIGWAWSVFRDYDFGINELEFRGRTVRALAAAASSIRHLGLADSVGIDFHKTGYVPYISSLVLFRDRDDLGLITRRRETMPYLFQSGQHHPGMFTLETSRSATGPMSALASLLLLGREGLRVLLGHAVEMSEVLREMIEAQPRLSVMNRDNVGPVTLFRVYPRDVDTFKVKQREQHEKTYRDRLLAHNELNRQIYERVHTEALAGFGVAISLTDCYRRTDYGEPINALKSYVLSPFADEAQMRSVLTHVLTAAGSIG
ncbi:MAG: aspartate aminotransferase family protein [Planctomycetota bacterium]|nr:MAG: aspartate aminotransferase family protein [Planctomycetota bacterium]